MRSSLLFACIALAALFVLSTPCASQAPNPPPIWPSQFLARFGLYQFDIPSNSPIFNETSYFSYNIDFGGQLINYPERCVPIFPGGEFTPCQILFLDSGIYWSQPGLDIVCCQLFSDVGPTPRNFTRGFNWNTTGVASDYFGNYHQTDVYVSPDYSFKYWTELHTHHDVFFRDGGGAFWAWDHLNVTSVDPSVFNLFSDGPTCSQTCASALSMTKEEEENMLQTASKHAPIQLALHHHKLAQKEKKEQEERKKRHIHHKKHHAAAKKSHQ